MKKYLSYIWPLTTKIESDFNGIMEVTWYNGRKVLNSRNTNYSYGSLQKTLEQGISKIDLSPVKSTLLLGLGGGSIISSLRNKFGYSHMIEAVDIDPKIIALAEAEFSIAPSNNLHIQNADAFEFVKVWPSGFDLIIIDVFIDSVVPDKFYSLEFCKNLAERLNKPGFILFNLGINLDPQDASSTVINYFSKSRSFICSIIDKVQKTNTLLIIERKV